MRLFWMDIDMEMVDIMVAMLRRISEGFPTQETFLSFLMRLQWGNDNLLITLHFGWSNYYCLIIYKQNVHGFLGPMFVGRPLPIFHGDSLWCKNIMLNSIPSNIIIDNWTLKHWANNLFKVMCANHLHIILCETNCLRRLFACFLEARYSIIHYTTFIFT